VLIRLTPVRPSTWLVFALQATAGVAAPDYDRVWDHAILYENDTGALRELALSGRLHWNAIWIDAEQGSLDDTDRRRFRFGFRSEFSHDWSLRLEADFDLNAPAADWYTRLTDAYIGYTIPRGERLKLLKHSAGFTLDGATSSNRLLTPERSNLTNNLWFTNEYFTGVSLDGNAADRWSYRFSVFSSADDREFSTLDAGYFLLTSVGYDLAPALQLDSASLRVDYVYNDEHPDNGTRDFGDVVSLSSKWQQSGWGLWTDLAAGRGYFDQPDLLGLSLMAFRDTSQRLQWVVRYTFLDSDGANGVRLPRYPTRVTSGRGDRYQELYMGFNVYFYSDKLKWQTGLEYGEMEDRAADGGAYEGWSLITAVRLYW
jgi:phosphate-selective porin OprO/OprP